jgi:hypothetical protein
MPLSSMKALLIIGIIIVLLLAGAVCLYYLGTSVKESITAKVTDGTNQLTLKLIHRIEWGNSYAAKALYFNDKLVDFYGIMAEAPGEGNKFFPIASRAMGLRVTTFDTLHAEKLHQQEWRNMKQVIYTHYSTETTHDLNDIFPNDQDIAPWTVWVHPKDFTESEYQNINTLLSSHHLSLMQQQKTFDKNFRLQLHPDQKIRTLLIWRTVYHDYQSLPSETFVHKSGASEEKIIIKHYGSVEYYQKSQLFPYGCNCTLGQLQEYDNEILIDTSLSCCDVSFTVMDFSLFKDITGRKLTEVYRLYPLHNISNR